MINNIASCYFVASAFQDYLKEYHKYCTSRKWDWQLQTLDVEDLLSAYERPKKLMFWAIKIFDNIAATYCMRFDDCLSCAC